MSRYSVDFDQLDLLVGRLAGFVGYLSDRLDVLDKHLAGLDVVWEGPAAAQAVDVRARYREGVGQMLAAAQAMHQVVVRVSGNYSSVQDVNYRMWGG